MQTKINAKNIFDLAVGFTILTLSGSFGIILRFLSLDGLLNFNRKYLIPHSNRLILKIIGVKLDLPKENPIKNGQFLITFNHNSYFDIFALTSLGYTNTVFVLSEKTIKILPLTLAALSIGVKYIPQKHYEERRLRFFKKLTSKVQHKKINIAASSEGVHTHHHGIDEFNKGVYHLATAGKLDIIPLFINIAEESNPFDKYKSYTRGVVKIEILNTIDTQNWNLADLVTNKESVREVFVKKFNEVHQTEIQ